jgi:hypothetical protein
VGSLAHAHRAEAVAGLAPERRSLPRTLCKLSGSCFPAPFERPSVSSKPLKKKCVLGCP